MTQEYTVSTVENEGVTFFLVAVEPISSSSKQHHISCQKRSETQADSIHLALANIQGLITRKKKQMQVCEGCHQGDETQSSDNCAH